jgi:glycolate oxidase
LSWPHNPETWPGVLPQAEAAMVEVVAALAPHEHVHINVLKDDLPEAQWEALVPGLTEQIYNLALSLGGTITGEHGIGATRRRYLHMALSEAQIDLMRQIRQVFDPNRILNPGKIFP